MKMLNQKFFKLLVIFIKEGNYLNLTSEEMKRLV